MSLPVRLTLVAAMIGLLTIPAMAVMPVVKTVPWDPNNAGAPHDTVSGRSIELKATTNVSGSNFEYQWDYGDGTSTAWGNVTNPYNIGVSHTYTAAVGAPFTAKVYVRDKTTFEVASANYLITVRAASLQVDVNMAIDRALWRLHCDMSSRSGSGSTMVGRWNGGSTGSGNPGNDAVNVNAFLANGHKPDWNVTNPNPYAETIARGINWVLNSLASTSIANYNNKYGAVIADKNANGIALYVNGTYPAYQGGMVIDMLVATDMPDLAAPYGAANVVGRKFRDIVQDLIDYYAYCQQHNGGTTQGGWRYGCQYGSSDNSFNQWGIIGMLAAERNQNPLTDFYSYIDPNMIALNADWTAFSHYTTGTFGYDYPNSFAWGPHATTPSGMVQLALQRKGRGNPLWDTAEAYVRNNWTDSSPNWSTTSLGYYYGLFSFTKAMLLHDNGTTPPGANSLSDLCSRDAGNNLVNCINWYSAERSAGAPVNGVARTLVNTQNASGYWSGHEYTGEQNYFETAWATIMLRRTVFASGLPVAVIDASPVSLANGGKVNLTGKNSFHQNSSKNIVKWDWDFNNDGVFDATGVNQLQIPFSVPSPPGTRTVRLRVTDDSVPPLTADAVVVITITSPPYPPTANAGGPYSICPQAAYLPFFLNGTGSRNPDDGMTDGSPGATPDAIREYAWDLLGTNNYVPMGAQPRVDDVYATAGKLGTGVTYLVGLRVTDKTSTAYPTSGQPDLQGFSTTQVLLRSAADALCTKCVSTAQAMGKAASGTNPAMIQLLWLETGSDHYNIYRGLANGGPYTLVGSVKNTVLGTGKTMAYTDMPVQVGITYYYRIAPATLADIETCQSNQANVSAKVTPTR